MKTAADTLQDYLCSRYENHIKGQYVESIDTEEVIEAMKIYATGFLEELDNIIWKWGDDKGKMTAAIEQLKKEIKQ